ncbi:tetratricopeptide repeat protein [Streptomyces hygroscopicus]|uniref:tetratricopeptide repeat protein n=1 Tax=Streptomyces hygroscopicus TaxID=1912 RepID=UPI0036B8E657
MTTEASGPRSVAAQNLFGMAATGDYPHLEQHITYVHQALPSLPAPASVDAPRGLHNLTAPDAVFEGRTDALAQLERLARSHGPDTGRVTTVQGLGGIGKSTLARHHARAHLDSHTPTWWITADTPQRIDEGLAKLTRALNPTVSGEVVGDAAVGWAVAWLQAHHGWLLVLDNVEEPAHIRDLLGRLTTGRIIITTRRNLGCAESGAVLPLGVLDLQSSVRTLIGLTGRTGERDRQAASELARDLGYLPLALQQAGAYIAQTRIGIADYLDSMRGDPGAPSPLTGEGGRAETTRVWRLTLRLIEERHPQALALLRALSHFAPDNVPRDLLGPVLGGVREVNDALGVLSSYSMISLTEDTVSTHRLVQAVVRASDHDDAHRRGPWSRRRRGNGWAAPVGQSLATALDVLMAALAPEGPMDPAGWPRWQALLPHIESAVDGSPDVAHHLPMAWLVGGLGDFLLMQGQSTRALPYQIRALTITENVLGPYHPETAVRLVQLAYAYQHFGRPADALPLAQRALDITMNVLGPHHPYTAGCLSSLASTLYHLGRPAEALPLAEEALAISEATFGPGHQGIAAHLAFLCRTYSWLGRHDSALSCATRAFSIAEATLGNDHPYTAMYLGDLAMAHSALGRYAEALPFELRALSIVEDGLGPYHPYTAIRLRSLAVIYRGLGHDSLALPLAERALAVHCGTLGAGNPATQDVWDLVVGLRQEAGEG